MMGGLAHELWALAQLLPEEGVKDGVNRVEGCLNENFEELIGIVRDFLQYLPDTDEYWITRTNAYKILNNKSQALLS